MRTNVLHIFAIGGIVGQRMLAHKAVQEAHKWLGRLSNSPMVAPHVTVTHRPHGAKHLHNLHQAQPFDDGVDPGSDAKRRLKRHPRFAHQHRICTGTL